MRYIVSSYDVFNAIGNVRAGLSEGASPGDVCCNHSCNGHECTGHTDIQNYVMRLPDEINSSNYLQ